MHIRRTVSHRTKMYDTKKPLKNKKQGAEWSRDISEIGFSKLTYKKKERFSPKPLGTQCVKFKN